MEKSLGAAAQLDARVRELTRELLELTVTPHVRELRAKAVTYGRVIGNWAVYSPTPPQVQAMVECIDELEAKVAEAKREGNPDISRITRRRNTTGPAPATPSGSLLPSAIPPSLGWNASVPETTGIRARHISQPQPIKRVAELDEHEAPTKPPPALSTSPPRSMPPLKTSAPPPVSAPRPLDDHPTPVPALLRSRRSH